LRGVFPKTKKRGETRGPRDGPKFNVGHDKCVNGFLCKAKTQKKWGPGEGKKSVALRGEEPPRKGGSKKKVQPHKEKHRNLPKKSIGGEWGPRGDGWGHGTITNQKKKKKILAKMCVSVDKKLGEGGKWIKAWGGAV